MPEPTLDPLAGLNADQLREALDTTIQAVGARIVRDTDPLGSPALSLHLSDGTTCTVLYIAPPAPEPIDPETLREVLDGYQACATWCAVPLSASESDESFDDLGVCDWDAAAEAECRADCEAFIRDNLATLLRVTDATDYTWECVGHDLWLSRNGHGSGFFARVRSGDPLEDDFDALQEAASALGEVDLDIERDGSPEARVRCWIVIA